MLRHLHSLPGLLAGLLVVFMALTGSFLSLQPAIEQAHATSGQAMDTATLAGTVAANFPGVTRLVKMASGTVIAYVDAASGQSALRIDPATGASLGTYEPSPAFAFMTELHRSLFLGQGGHVVAAVAALAMLILSLSGGVLVVRRMGGWSKVLGAARGAPRQRLHVDIGRFVLVALLLTGVTGAYMSLVSLGLVSTGPDGFMAFPDHVDGGAALPIASLVALQATPLGDLRELVFPAIGDPTDVFTLTTNAGQGFIDQATGAMLSFVPNTLGQTIYETFYALHTGQGIWWLGLILGVAALGVPVMAASGLTIWWMRRRGLPRLTGNVSAGAADTIILVGSEGNSTWGFAATLHDALTNAGHRVHTAPMNSLASRYGRARHMFILAATYGDGAAPQSANRFLARLRRTRANPDLAFTVLGFGDRSFNHFCQFAEAVGVAMQQRGWTAFQPIDMIDRQSAQSFAQWGERIGRAIGMPLRLVHAPVLPATRRLNLIERDDYGVEVQAPTSVLRFAAPVETSRVFKGWLGLAQSKLPRFEAGDLVGIVPPGSQTPRYYSLATSTRDGVLEICVRKQQGGLCSEFLHGLLPGDSIAMSSGPTRISGRPQDVCQSS